MKEDYPKEVIDYAIDNKMSLDEAYNIYILQGLDKEPEEENDSFTLSGEEVEAPEFNLKDELKFLHELEKKIKLEQKNNDNVTKDDLDWVDFQLEQIDNMSD